MADERLSPELPTGIVAAAVFVLATALLLLIFYSPGGRDATVRLGEYEPEAVERAVEEALTPVRLRPARDLRVSGRRVRWLDPTGRPFLEAPAFAVTVQLNAAPYGGIMLSSGVVSQPRLRLVQTGEAQWNYDRPLAPFFRDDGSDDAGSALAVRLRNIEVRNGHVLLDLLEDRYEVRSLDLMLSNGQVTGPGLEAPEFGIRTAQAELVLPDTAEGQVVRAVTAADARVRVLDGAVEFDVATATFGSSLLASLHGVWDPSLGGYGVNMDMTAVDARVADLPWLPGAVPEGASGSFQLRMEPRSGDRTMLALSNLDLRAPGSSATGSVRAVIGGASPVLEAIDLRVDPLSLDLVEAFTGPLPYGGTVAGTVQGTGGDIRFDLRGRLTTPTIPDPFTTDLTGRVALTDDGFTLRDATVTFDRTPLLALRALAPNLPFTGPVTGSVTFTGAPGTSPLDLDVRLEAGGGIITLQGMVDPTAAVPVYDLTGRLAGVRIQSLLEPPVPPAEVHATFALEGRGVDPRTARAALTANGRFTGWESQPGDTLAVRLDVAGGVVDVEDLALRVGPVQVAAAGRWDFVGGTGSVGYDAVVAEMGPLAPYLPPGPAGDRTFARGSLRLTGTASGTLERPALSGEARAEEFRWGEWAADSFTADYAVALTDGLPRIDAEATADRLRTPFGNFERVEATVEVARSVFAVAVRADQEAERGILEVTADGVIDELGRREIYLRSLEVDLQQERWRLPEPALIAWAAGERVRIEGVELIQTDGEGRIIAGGIIAPLDDMDLSVDVVGLPVGDVLELAGIEAELAGDMSLVGRIAGPAAAPELDLRLALTAGSFRGVAVRSLESQLSYDDGRLVVDGMGLLGDSARIEIAGSIPARVRLAGDTLFRLSDDGAIDLEISTRTFPLATLDPGLTFAEDLEGQLEADVRVSGSPAAASLSGSARLVGGAVTLPLLGRRFPNIHGQIVLSGRQARIQQFVVESDGFAEVEGTLDFQQLTNPTLDLTARLQEFRVQGLDDEKAAGFWGGIRLGGTLAQPLMTGSIRADDGAISLAPLQQPDLSARLAGGDLDMLDPGGDLDLSGPAEDEGLRIQNMAIEAGSNLWFVTDEVRVRVSGALTFEKIGTSTPIQGTLRGDAGTFQLAVGPIYRQFRIVSAEIRFFGSPEPNPRLDIVASRLVRVPDGADVDVQVQVEGTLTNPSLNLAAATGGDIPESELLSFLLFGRPTSALGQAVAPAGATGFLGQGLAEALFSEINEEVELFDYFAVDYVPGGATFATLGMELSDNWLLTTEFLLGTESDISAVALEYEAGIGTARFAYEPVESLQGLVGTRSLSYLRAEIVRQWVVAWRKRWTY